MSSFQYSSLLKTSFPIGMSWLLVFLPALIYFVMTRLIIHESSSGGFLGLTDLGVLVTDTVTCHYYHPHHSSSNDKMSSLTPSFSSSSSSKNLLLCCKIFQSTFYVSQSFCRATEQHPTTNKTLDNKLYTFDTDRTILSLTSGLRKVETASIPTDIYNSKSNIKRTANSNDNSNQGDAIFNENDSTTSATAAFIVDLQWIHDDELGRGYLLYSYGNRIWRWERGGGPIAIGRTLHLDHAGCRSNHFRLCSSATTAMKSSSSGSHINHVGAMAVQDPKMANTKKHITSESTTASKFLLIAEWGEGRIVRMESETGSRTPIIIEIPSTSINTYIPTASCPSNHEVPPSSKLKVESEVQTEKDQERKINQRPSHALERLSHNPRRMIYVDDALFVVVDRRHQYVCTKNPLHLFSHDEYSVPYSSMIVRLDGVSKIPAIPSLRESRVAHSWSSMQYYTSTTSNESNTTNKASNLTVEYPIPWLFGSYDGNDGNENGGKIPVIHGIATLRPNHILNRNKYYPDTKAASGGTFTDHHSSTIVVSVQYQDGTLAILDMDVHPDEDDDDEDDNNDSEVDNDDDTDATYKNESGSSRRTTQNTESSSTTESITDTDINKSNLHTFPSTSTGTDVRMMCNITEYLILSGVPPGSVRSQYDSGDMVIAESGTIFVAINVRHEIQQKQEHLYRSSDTEDSNGNKNYDQNDSQIRDGYSMILILKPHLDVQQQQHEQKHTTDVRKDRKLDKKGGLSHYSKNDKHPRSHWHLSTLNVHGAISNSNNSSTELLSQSNSIITALELGTDGYLYVAVTATSSTTLSPSSSSLLREGSSYRQSSIYRIRTKETKAYS